MTRLEAKQAMVRAIGDKLRDWREQHVEYVTYGSLEQLRQFAHGELSALRLVVNMQHLGNESQRCITISLVPRQAINGYCFRVKIECSMWSTTRTQTEEALKGWGLVHGLALVALRTADALPPIMDEVAA